MWTLRLSEQAQRFYSSLSGKHQIQMAHGLDRLVENPHLGKSLRGELRGYWSYRVGVYRIIYVIRRQEIIVEVLRIHHRKEVYEKFRR
ncbi:MAG: type II toxin-antitoxin system RelE/ParE family toxin [Deltaproteobacteria bacterium]|nr:type II toxin-antitoxin system RelE/ParE family toxin [Deltaproteobacteria bacterium]